MDVDTIRLDKKHFKQVRLNKNNNYYEFLLHICEVIYDNLLVDESNGKTKFKEFDRDERQMAYLYENFLRNFYRRELKGYRVFRENISWDAEVDDALFSQYLPRMQTDISLESANRKIIIDAKYYKDVFTYNMDAKKLNSGNLYQMFAYLKNIEAKGGQAAGCEGILLYPQTGEPLNVDYLIQGHRIKIRTVDLYENWPAIHIRLLDIIG